MIIQKTVTIGVSYRTFQYWKDKGYDVVYPKGKNKNPQQIEVKVSDLSEKSPILVECKCDECGSIYNQRYSRNTNVCSKCRSKVGHKIPDEKRQIIKDQELRAKLDFLSDLDLYENIVEAKSKLGFAKKYGTTLQVINNYLKHRQIKLPAYFGTKLTPNKTNNILESLELGHNDMAELAIKYSCSRSVIRRIAKENNITLDTNQFEKWEESYRTILKNFDIYKELNKTRTLLDISNEHNISVEQLKKAFRENNIPVILHSQNKSKGEIELKSFVQSLGFEGKSIKKFFDGKRYEIDCFIEEKDIGIEYCGEWWHCDKNKEPKYHQNKYLWAKNQSIDLLTIFENEWKNQ